jgi:hypothetical protein
VKIKALSRKSGPFQGLEFSLFLLTPLLLCSWLLSHFIFVPYYFTHGLNLHPEEGSSIFLENSGEFQADYTTSHSSRWSSSR